MRSPGSAGFFQPKYSLDAGLSHIKAEMQGKGCGGDVQWHDIVSHLLARVP
jgi:hypothetical protein